MSAKKENAHNDLQALSVFHFLHFVITVSITEKKHELLESVRNEVINKEALLEDYVVALLHICVDIMWCIFTDCNKSGK